MEKLSRTEKYKEYRSEINNDGEKEIATKELKELQDKLIINEKRFGNNSRTESDFNRGIKGSTLDDIYNIFGPSNIESEKKAHHTKKIEHDVSFDTLDDIFNEIDKVDITSNQDEHAEEDNDYIRKIKEIVLNDSREDSIQQLDENSNEDNENIKQKEPFLDVEEYDEQSLENTIETAGRVLTSLRGEVAEFEEPKSESIVVQNEVNINPKNDDIQPQSLQEEDRLSSILQTQALEKPIISVFAPQEDTSKEYIEVCENVNRLAAAVEDSNAFLKEDFIREKTIANRAPADLLHSDAKKETTSGPVTPSFMNNLENELNMFSQSNDEQIDDNITESTDKQLHPEEKKEIIENVTLKKEYANTVSMEADKLRDEINSLKTDHISVDAVLNANHLLENDSRNNTQEGKTIAFNVGNEKNASTSNFSDNTFVIEKPIANTSSIHTMSFKKEDLELENNEKSNTILNIILVLLILVAVAALGAIVYFFLITRGIL